MRTIKNKRLGVAQRIGVRHSGTKIVGQCVMDLGASRE
jgi:hypothetical protein